MTWFGQRRLKRARIPKAIMIQPTMMAPTHTAPQIEPKAENNPFDCAQYNTMNQRAHTMSWTIPRICFFMSVSWIVQAETVIGESTVAVRRVVTYPSPTRSRARIFIVSILRDKCKINSIYWRKWCEDENTILQPPQSPDQYYSILHNAITGLAI
jgi:hypothetical protein